jgi:hypothetical protein
MGEDLEEEDYTIANRMYRVAMDSGAQVWLPSYVHHEDQGYKHYEERMGCIPSYTCSRAIPEKLQIWYTRGM